MTKVGDKVTVRFPPDYGFWTFEATALERPARIEMTCIEAHHKVEGQPKEIDQECWEQRLFGASIQLGTILRSEWSMMA